MEFEQLFTIFMHSLSFLIYLAEFQICEEFCEKFYKVHINLTTLAQKVYRI